jgi:septal ring factor EnvC (AmiA/AmiB activator)
MRILLVLVSCFFMSQAFASKKANASKKDSNTLSVASAQVCLSATDSLEREFCQKKRLKAINEEFAGDLKKFEAGLTQAQKDEARAKLAKNIETNQEFINLLTTELKAHQENLAKLELLPSEEEKQKAQEQNDKNKQKEELDKIKKAVKKIFK